MTDKSQGGIQAGSTSVTLTFMLRKTVDSTEQTGKVASNLTLSYWRLGGLRTAVSPSDLAAVDSAWFDGGIKEVDAVNLPGVYRIDWPDAAFAVGADFVEICVLCAGCYSYNERIPISDVPTASETADAFLDLSAIEANMTMRQAMRLMLATLCGKASGFEGTTVSFRDTNDTVNRVVATVDTSGNRTAVILDSSEP